jgi:hypothetical protein
MRQLFFHRFASDDDGVVQIGAGIRFCARGQGPVPCGSQATAPESGWFPPILSRQGRDAPPGRRILWYLFHPLDWEKSQFLLDTDKHRFYSAKDLKTKGLSDTDEHGYTRIVPWLPGLFRCPGKGKFPAVKTRREIHGLEALPGLPQSDVDTLRRLLSIQTKDP